MKKIVSLSLLLSLWAHALYTMEKNQLTQVAKDYLQFVHDVGSGQSVQSDDLRINELFAEKLTKIDNRITLFANNRQLLLPQMKGFEKEENSASDQVSWVIHKDQALIVPSTETNSVVVYFEWTHAHVGRATTMAILRCNQQGQIQCIIDVWAKVQG